MTRVQNAWNASDIAEIEFVVFVFRTACCQNDRVAGKLLGKISIIVTGFHSSITSGHHKETLDISCFNGRNDLICDASHRVMCKTANNCSCL
ncbi:hypothetical protein D3C81_1248080 [compost metagenome]